jgi:hypothetical protein
LKAKVNAGGHTNLYGFFQLAGLLPALFSLMPQKTKASRCDGSCLIPAFGRQQSAGTTQGDLVSKSPNKQKKKKKKKRTNQTTHEADKIFGLK